jgi:hypothetical protein
MVEVGEHLILKSPNVHPLQPSKVTCLTFQNNMFTHFNYQRLHVWLFRIKCSPTSTVKGYMFDFSRTLSLSVFFRKFLGTIFFIYIDMIESIGSTCMTISRLFITINKFDCKTIILALVSPSDDDLFADIFYAILFSKNQSK